MKRDVRGLADRLCAVWPGSPLDRHLDPVVKELAALTIELEPVENQPQRWCTAADAFPSTRTVCAAYGQKPAVDRHEIFHCSIVALSLLQALLRGAVTTTAPSRVHEHSLVLQVME